MVAAGVVVGATAVTLGVVSARSEPRVPVAAGSAPAAVVYEAQETSDQTGSTQELRSSQDVAVIDEFEGQDLLAQRVHEQVAESLPRIQAASDGNMRDGSGLFITDEGHIATSAGLVADADYILVWTADGSRWHGEIVASDHLSDVAVLQIPTTDWPAAVFGSQELLVGQYALAIDHQTRSMNVGQVMAQAAPLPGASPEVARILLQHSRAVPGAAIVDDTGEVIGMTNASSNAHATPAWQIGRVSNELIASGQASHTWLGIEVAPSGDRMVKVLTVAPDSPADVANLRPGDLIDSIDGTTVSAAADVASVVQVAVPGDQVALTVTRHGSRRMIYATLSSRTDSD